jgi:hypothetical protein
MPEKAEQELLVKVRSLKEEANFRLWAASLSHALQETAPIDITASSNRQVGGRNGGSSGGATSAASLVLEDEQRGGEDAKQEYLTVMRRLVNLQRERLLLEQDAIRLAVEDLSHLQSGVQPGRMKAATAGQNSQNLQDETESWYHVEEPPSYPARGEVQGTARPYYLAAEAKPNAAEQTGQQIQLWSPELTPYTRPQLAASETLLMLLPNPDYPQPATSGVGRAFARSKRKIIRYSKSLWRRLT